MNFTQLPHCQSRLHCDSCRSDPSFRKSLVEQFGPFTCPIAGRMPVLVNLVFDTRPLVVHAPGQTGKNSLWQALKTEFFQSPKKNYGDCDDLTILTWNNRPRPGVTQRCLDHLGIRHIVLGQDITDWKNLYKNRLTAEALQSIQTRYVMGLDAPDVLLLAHPQQILERFRRRFSCRLLFGSEVHCFPEVDALRRFENSLPHAVTSPWRFLNSGMWLGETAFCREFFAQAAETEPWDGDERFLRSDQGVLKKVLRRFYPQADLDYGCTLFQNINLHEGDLQRMLELESRLSAVTVCLLNWKRPQNVPRVLDSLMAQTLRPTVFLWNNGKPFHDERIAWQVDSSENMGCWPRWFMASRAQTEYVCTLDDDLVLGDETILEDAVSFLAQRKEHTVIGPEGVRLVFGQPYRHCDHIAAPETDKPVSIVKGRMMLMRRRALERVPFSTAYEVAKDADDIAVSALVAGGKPNRHVIPALFRGRLQDLEEYGVGLKERPAHHERREAARRKYFMD